VEASAGFGLAGLGSAVGRVGVAGSVGIALGGEIGSALAVGAVGVGNAPRAGVLPGVGMCCILGLLEGGCIVDRVVVGGVLPGCRILAVGVAAAAVHRISIGDCASTCSAPSSGAPRSGW